MKVLCVTETSDRPESALIAGISDMAITVDVVCRSDSPWQNLFKERCRRVFALDVRRRVDIRAVRSLRRIVAEGDYDLIHAFTGRTVSAMVLGTIGLRCVRVSYRGTVGHLSRFDPTNWISFLAPSVDRTMCVSNAVRSYMIECGVPPERAVTVYKGHRPEWYHAAPRSSLYEFGIRDDEVVAACVATIRPVKGVDILLEAVARIPENIPFRLLLIGEVRDSSVAALLGKEEVKRRVVALGHRRDATSLVGASDFAILPSRDREGFPKSILEAMSLGKAVIASRVGGIPEILTDGIDGVLVSPGDVDELSRAITSLVLDRDRLAAFGIAARKTVESRFTVDSSVRALLSLYQGIPELSGHAIQRESPTMSG